MEKEKEVYGSVKKFVKKWEGLREEEIHHDSSEFTLEVGFNMFTCNMDLRKITSGPFEGQYIGEPFNPMDHPQRFEG